MAAGTPDRHPPHRDVSPLGASRFEQPYHPPRPQTVDRDASTAPNLPAATAPSSRSCGTVASDVKAAQPAASTSLPPCPRPGPAAKAKMETSPSTVGSDDFTYLRWHEEKNSIESPVCVVSPDDWFDHFNPRRSLDLSSEISKEDVCPDRATLWSVKDILLYDAEGTGRTFGSLHDPATASHERQLMIFVRHFYCGACQAYLKALSEGISISDYFSIPVPTSIIVIGCGEPDLIPHYKRFTGCPFPVFADPSRQLFKRLGMSTTLRIGRERPEYMSDISRAAWLGGQFATIGRSLRDPGGIRKRDVFRGGNPMQIGGEFLFEDGQVIFAHRMRHYRDHTEVSVLRQLLELDE